MTGGTSGLGRAAAAELLRRDPTMHLVLLARGTALTNNRGTALTKDRVTVIKADLASLGSVREASRDIGRRLASGELPPLSGLAGNAGVSLADALHTTADGYESTFAVNVIANHLLISELAPLLRAPARIVVTVSDSHFGDFRHTLGALPGPRWADPAVLARPGAFPRPETPVAGRTAYTTSKLAAIHLVHEWARRLPAGIDIVAYNPGVVPGTGLAREAGPFARALMGVLSRPLLLTPLADSVAAAGRKLADAIDGSTAASSGDYVDRTRAARSSAESYERNREHALWTFLDGVAARVGR
ncbi:dehydrogenase/reductase [Paractinoplanes abujensis]|nr:dehydrogenase/reductase [Actinoplanes abujensis]